MKIYKKTIRKNILNTTEFKNIHNQVGITYYLKSNLLIVDYYF